MDALSEIVALEWEAFQAVNNIGGRASCQDDGSTFVIMRRSQLEVWSPEMRDSYVRDLLSAKACGRNLVQEKYARMMEWTSPARFGELKSRLLPIGDAAHALVEEIVAIHMEWQRDYVEAYPRLAARGRMTGRNGDSFGTSFETYLRGELLTYSERTLRLYLAHLQRMAAENVNLNICIMDHTARSYGYASAEDAERSLA